MQTTVKRSRLPWIILIVVVVVIVVAVVGLGASRSGRGGSSAASSTLTSKVARGDVTSDVTASGQIVDQYTYSVSAGSPAVLTAQDGVASGSSIPSASTTSTSTSTGTGSSSSGAGGSTDFTTTELDVAAGGTVTAGQVLAKASSSASDATSLQAALTSATASLNSAYNALSSDQSSYDSLTSTSSTSTPALNDAQKQISADNAAIAQAQAAQASAQTALDAGSVSVTSPAAGQVLSVGTAVGASASPVATIGAGATELSIMVSEYDVPKVQLKQAVDVTLGNSSTTFAGTVSRISSVSTDASGVQQYQVVVSSTALPATARVGMTVTASITIATHTDVLHVPASAVTTTAGKSTVTVVSASGSDDVKTVTLGLIGVDSVEITSGLKAGEKVVTGASGTVPATTSGGGIAGHL